MCYGVKARTEMSLRIAKSRGDQVAMLALSRLLSPFPELDLHFANGFTHPRLVVYTSDRPTEPQLMEWGLVPAWVKDTAQRDQLWNRTLLARWETLFEKPAFRTAARQGRCLVFVECFYEHHHLGKRAYPCFIRLKEREHFALAALWECWPGGADGAAQLTFSIVTTAANPRMRQVHNKPGPEGARMPLILTEEEESLWLAPCTSAADEAALRRSIGPCPADALEGWTVKPLLGKHGNTNNGSASEPFTYPELQLVDPFV